MTTQTERNERKRKNKEHRAIEALLKTKIFKAYKGGKTNVF